MALREKISIMAGFCHELKKGLLSHADDLCIYNWLFVLTIIPVLEKAGLVKDLDM